MPHRVDTAQELCAQPQSADRPHRERGATARRGCQHAGQDRIRAAALVADEEDDPSASGVMSERMTSGLDSGGSSAIDLLRFDPSVAGGAGPREAQVSGDRLAVGSYETVGEACAA